MTEEEKTILLTQHDGQIKRHEGRIRDLERRQDDLDKLVTAMATVEQKQASMDEDLKEIKKDVKTLAQRPGKRWDAIVEKALAALVGALVSFFLLRAGIG